MPPVTPNPALDERWLKRAAWWARNRELLQKVGLAIVVLVEALLIIFSGYTWLDYLWFNRAEERRLYQELSQTNIDFELLHKIYTPQPIAVLEAVTLAGSGADGAYDVLVKFSNANPNWLATVVYQFVSDAGISPVEEVVVLNGEERFIVGSGVVKSASATPEVNIVVTRWQRIRDLARFNERKPRLKISDVSFSPVAEKGRSGSGPVNRVKFTVTNESIFSFWSVSFTVVLSQNDRPVAARYTTIEQVRTGERREVSLNINTVVSSVNKVLVVPEVNIADPDVFMSLSGESIGF